MMNPCPDAGPPARPRFTRRLPTLFACLTFVGTLVTSTLAQDFLWIEAEDFTSASSSYLESNEVLSDGEWVRLNDTQSDRFIEWDGITIPEDGTWEILVRKFWKHGPFHWTLDGPTVPTPAGVVNADVVLLDEAELYKFNVANWVFVTEVELKAGDYTFRINQDAPDGAAAYDAILFSRASFTPRGKLKPGEAYPSPIEPDSFDFQPEHDAFAPTPIDLRHLNEARAGSRGWIRRDGAQFEYPDNGERVRFWGINLGPGIYSLDNARIRHLARFYAKRGVNLVRLHGSFYEGGGTAMGTVKPWTLDRINYAVKAFRDEGIYVMLSAYFPLWVDIAPDDNRFPGYNNGHPFALPFFSPAFEALFQDWFDALLDTRNPYTGLKLADDPAVLACELVNEDSLFFWTFNSANIPDPQMRILETQFGAWVSAAGRYGSAQAAASAWGETRPRDNPAEGRLEIKPMWDLGNTPHTQRDKDTVRFLAETQKAFFERNRDYLKDTLDYGGMVYGSNWITAQAHTLAPIDKWTNAGLDFLDRHGYYSTLHLGDASSYDVRAGTAYRDRSALRFDAPDSFDEKSFATPIMGINYGGLPSIITEINWPEPNQYRADCIPTIAAYAALQGIDGVVLFATESPDWDSHPGKFPMQTPVTLAQFPGFALAYRRGLIRAGSPAIDLTLYEDNLFNLEGTPVPQPENLDQLRDPGIGGGPDSVSSLAFLVGPVNVGLAEGGGTTVVEDTSGSFIDTDGRIVRSNTDELVLDYGTGLLTLDAPQVQGASGFLSQAGIISLSEVTLESGMPYGSILVVALDDTPIAASERILVQVASDDHFAGFSTREIEPGDSAEIKGIPDGKVIINPGSAPIMVAEFEGSLGLTRPDAASLTVTACDENGIPLAPIGTADSFSLSPDVFYYLIHTTPPSAPAAPPAPSAEAVRHDSIHLQWPAVEGATSYEIELARDALFEKPVEGLSDLNVGARNETFLSGLPLGTYFARVRATNLAGTGAGSAATSVEVGSRLINLSTRGGTAETSALIAGFVISGPDKVILVRAAANALLDFGVTGTVPDPRLRLVNQSTGETIALNDNWDATDPEIAAATLAAGAGLQLAPGGLDSVIVAKDLQPGAYIAIIESVTGEPGVVLLEIYEVDPVERLINISTRGHTVAAGADVMIPGTIFEPSAKRLLIRVVGETLAQFVDPALVLMDPVLELYNNDAPREPMLVNDDWDREDLDLVATWTGASPQQVSSLPFANGSKDAAVMVVLEKNQAGHTVRAKGKNGAEGTVLVEIYEVM